MLDPDAPDPLARLRQALLAGHLPDVEAAARALPAVPLREALNITLLLHAKRDPRAQQAGDRLAARLVDELGLNAPRAKTAWAWCDQLADRPEQAGLRLRGLLGDHGR